MQNQLQQNVVHVSKLCKIQEDEKNISYFKQKTDELLLSKCYLEIWQFK